MQDADVQEENLAAAAAAAVVAPVAVQAAVASVAPITAQASAPVPVQVSAPDVTQAAAPTAAAASAAPAAFLPAAAASDALTDRYEILQEISRGGMGVVYKARHKILNNIVAVKVLLQPGSETDQRRFLQEAQLASKVNHPNTVYISDFGVLPDGKAFLVMEYMEGPTLTALLRKQERHQLDMLRACRIAAQIAQGMQTVHDKGIVHRD